MLDTSATTRTNAIFLQANGTNVPVHQFLYGVEDSLNLLQIQQPPVRHNIKPKVSKQAIRVIDSGKLFSNKQPSGKYIKPKKVNYTTEMTLNPAVIKFTKRGTVKPKKIIKKEYADSKEEIRLRSAGIDKSNIIKEPIARTDVLAKRRMAASVERRRLAWLRKNQMSNEKKPKKNTVETNTNCNFCKHCGIPYRKNLPLALHSIKHSPVGKYSCHLCPYISRSKSLMTSHVRAHEDTTKRKCNICNRAFTSESEANEHMNFHTGEKPFQCEICGKHFMFSRLLSGHRRSVHWEEVTGTPLTKFDCTICNKHYTSKKGLKRHQGAEHNGELVDTPTTCDTCGKTLASKEKLKFHQRIHTGYKPHVCAVCTKCFIRKEQLREHERVHTGERPFICPHCGKGFTQRSSLKIHIRMHTGERPYVCKLCHQGFISKASMDKHIKKCEEEYY